VTGAHGDMVAVPNTRRGRRSCMATVARQDAAELVEQAKAILQRASGCNAATGQGLIPPLTFALKVNRRLRGVLCNSDSNSLYKHIYIYMYISVYICIYIITEKLKLFPEVVVMVPMPRL